MALTLNSILDQLNCVAAIQSIAASRAFMPRRLAATPRSMRLSIFPDRGDRIRRHAMQGSLQAQQLRQSVLQGVHRRKVIFNALPMGLLAIFVGFDAFAFNRDHYSHCGDRLRRWVTA